MVFFKCHYCTAYVLYEYSYDVTPLEMYITCVVHDSTRRITEGVNLMLFSYTISRCKDLSSSWISARD